MEVEVKASGQSIKGVSHRSQIIIGLLLLVSFFLFTTPIEDGDCFWHIATGQWIWEHKSLPSADPFNFTSMPHPAGTPTGDRLHFYLSQYWLGQTALAGVWGIGGAPGIVIFRAMTYTAILAILFLWLKRRAEIYTALFVPIITAAHLCNYPNERPQLFTFLFMPIILLLVEDLRTAVKPKPLHWVGIPLLMLIWANCHGGYILGVAILLIYLACQLIPVSEIKQKWRQLAICTTSAAVSFINPCGWAAFHEIIVSMGKSTEFNIQEFLPPFKAAVDMHLYFPAYWLSLLLIIGILIFRFRRMALAHILTLLFLTALSLTALRFTPFLLFAAPLALIYIPDISKNILKAMVVLSLVLLGYSAEWKKVLHFEVGKLNPQGAAKFLAENRPLQNLFNYYDWGGYLLLYAPGYKTFIDGRTLEQAVFKRYKEALWSNSRQEIFSEYKINTVIMPAANEWTAVTYPLVKSLATDNSWHLVYSDAKAMVFVRNIPEHAAIISRFAIDKMEINRHILALFEQFSPEIRNRAEYWVSIGNARMKLGDYPNAATSFKQALSIDPHNQWSQIMLRTLNQ